MGSCLFFTHMMRILSFTVSTGSSGTLVCVQPNRGIANWFGYTIGCSKQSSYIKYGHLPDLVSGITACMVGKFPHFFSSIRASGKQRHDQRVEEQPLTSLFIRGNYACKEQCSRKGV